MPLVTVGAVTVVGISINIRYATFAERPINCNPDDHIL